jgi:hypothetical protein
MDYKQKIKALKEKLQVDKNKKVYVSLKDSNSKGYEPYYREQKTHQDDMSENKKQTIKDWKEKGYVKYAGKLQDIPDSQYLRFINQDNKILNGGYLMTNNVKDKFLFLRGIEGRGFSLQYDNIKAVYYNKEQMKKAQSKKASKLTDKQIETLLFEFVKQNGKMGSKRVYTEINQNRKVKIPRVKIEKFLREYKPETKPEKKSEPEPEKKIETPEPAPAPAPKTPEPKKLTEEQVNELLNDLYYDKGYYYGRDKLYQVSKDIEAKITRKQVEVWLKAQSIYQLTKPSKRRTAFTPIISKAPFNVMQIDIFKYGDIITLNSIDIFSKYTDSVILKNETAKQTIIGMRKILKRSPMKPKLIQSDNGPNFVSKEFTDYITGQDIKYIHSSPHTPQSQGTIERLQGSLNKYLEKLTLQNINITIKQINKFDKNYNNTPHSITKMKPIDAIKEENIKTVLERNMKAKAINLKPDKNDIQVGDKVRLSTSKNKIEKSPLNWTEELFTVVKVSKPRNELNPIRYKVEDNSGTIVKATFFRTELQKITKIENKDKLKIKYEVDKFVKLIRKGGKFYIKVRWKGYNATDDTLEPINKLKTDLGEDRYKELLTEMKNRQKKTDISRV